MKTLVTLLTLSVILLSEEKNVWDVTAEFGPKETINFTTSEGTWMSCDVSPDGRHIVFDLLGDIYIIPMAGGKATPLTSGPAWEVQPTFSNDGQFIAFTSDRSGGDNIWIMGKDGSEPRKVTNEKFRLLNNPVFTADDQYIIARKHFVDTRSLGAGEMWIYHVSGEGLGTTLTDRRNWQHDAGEPEISPDGKTLYYSQDVSPGNRFQYNRNPNDGIYAIHSIDLETGEKKTVTGGVGGSVTPQISPNGKMLAFVRRVGTKTVLFVRELATGIERPLFNRLDRDSQEAWSVFGPHPSYSWTPDGKAIVITAEGKLWRVHSADGEASEIPFTAELTKQLTETVRFKTPIGNSTFDVKTVRGTRVSPDGKRVVFEALGRLYTAAINGKNRKFLTSGSSGFEAQPVWSPDGKEIAFTTWRDRVGGGISIINAKGGKPRRLAVPRGHYFNPSWSPDGTIIVYRKGMGNLIRGQTHSVAPGIYVVPTKGGEQQFITKEGRRPVFSQNGERLLLHSRENDKNALISVNLSGSDRRIIATSKFSSRFVISPNDQWIAFTERFHVYVAPLPKTGKTIDLSPKMSSLPVVRMTKDSGFEAHWSAHSKTLHWTLGSELFSRKLSHSFAFAEGAPEELPDAPASGINLGWSEKSDIPNGSVALIGGRIITMNGDEVIENGTIVIQDNRIVAVGSADDLNVPRNVKTVNVSGKTLLPGFIDVHAHVGMSGDGLTAEQNWNFLANLAFGVTTNHDPSKDTETFFANSELQKAGKIIGPRLFSTGTILYGAVTGFTSEVHSVDDALSHLKRLKAFGAFSVKSYNQLSRSKRQQILKAARELEMNVVIEGGSTFQYDMTMIVDGHTGIEHNIPVSPLYNDVLTLYGASSVGYTPTLVVSFGGLSGEYYWYQHDRVFDHRRLLAFTPREILDRRARRRLKVEEDDFNHIIVAKATKALSDAGVKVNVGAHGQRQGLAAHWEMWMLAQGGMKPMEVLRAGTLNGAEYIGLDDDIGSLENGKLADLIVLNKNPLEDIRNTDSVELVMIDGRLYDAATMNQLFPEEVARPPFWWEQ
ncbi:MAG: amidohydrolase family protein [Candidatus Neomarinimicrobiota bacterium]|nr:amidohydrolase family protein [Candidatus Neomarinimicrobiota bacterium]